MASDNSCNDILFSETLKFTIEEIMNLMNLGNKKVNKMLIELEPHGLIYRRHQGLGKPNKMYYEDAKENAAFE